MSGRVAPSDQQIADVFLQVRSGDDKALTTYLKQNLDPNVHDKDGKSLMHLVCAMNGVELLDELVKHGGDLNAKDKDGWTALHHSSLIAGHDVVKTLLEKKADPNVRNQHERTALHVAAEFEHPEILELLLQHGAKKDIRDDKGRIPIDYASEDIKPILEGGGDAKDGSQNSEAAWFLAAQTGQEAEIDRLVGVEPTYVGLVDKDKWTALHHAAFMNQIDVIKALLKHKADPLAENKHGRTPLHLAAEWDNVDATKILMQHGANAQVKDGYGRSPMQYATAATMDVMNQGMSTVGGDAAEPKNAASFSSVLFKAAQVGQVDSMKEVLAEGSDVNAQDKDGWTALHHAAFMNQGDACAYLLEKAANASAQNRFGRTALHIAAEWDNDVVLKMLLEKGADKNIKDESGRMAIDYAADSTRPLLEEKAAKEEVSDETEWEVDRNDVAKEEEIGSGVTASVFRGTWRGTTVAIKEINWSTASMTARAVQAFHRELTIMLRLRHPNLVLFMGASTKSRPLLLICEFCAGGALFNCLHNQPQLILSWKQKLKMCLDIAMGMNFLHTCKPMIVHRDIKSLNLLLAEVIEDEHDKPSVKVADFGLSRIRNDDTHMTMSAGTYHWMAPEVLDGRAYNEKVDVYSYGIVMYEIICRQIPFEETGLEPLAIALKVTRGGRPDPSLVPPDCPGELVDLMERSWHGDPAERPPFDQIIKDLKGISISRPAR